MEAWWRHLVCPSYRGKGPFEVDGEESLNDSGIKVVLEESAATDSESSERDGMREAAN